MSTLNFTITASQSEFDDFADRLGYMSTLINELDVLIPNPETRSAFLVRIMKEQVAQKFYTPFVTAIEAEINTARDAEKETMRQTVRDRVAVNFVK